MAKIKAVLIDLDNTLYEYGRCNDAALETVIAGLSTHTGVEKSKVHDAYHESRKKVKELLGDTASSHSRFLYIQRTIEELKGKTDLALTYELHTKFWDKYMDHMELFEGVIHFFGQLKKAGIKTAIISDLTADIQFRKMMKLGLHDYIDYVITSEEAGKDKPHGRIFELALEKLGCKKDEVLIVGDDADREIKWATESGVMHIMISKGDFRHAMESLKEHV